jgi:hypothetical protein
MPRKRGTRRKQRGGSKYLVFYTCYFGPSANIADKIPEKPSAKYKCYYFSNNQNTLRSAEGKGFIPVFIDTPIKSTDRDNAVDSKELKTCPHHFSELRGYTYTCYFDSKLHVIEHDVEEFIKNELKEPTAMLLNSHPTNKTSVWQEYRDAMHSTRYSVNSSKYNGLIERKVKEGMKNTAKNHYETGFIIRKSGPLVDKMGEEWLTDIRETGAECQITFFFIQQKYKDNVKPLSKYYGVSK